MDYGPGHLPGALRQAGPSWAFPLGTVVLILHTWELRLSGMKQFSG